MKKYIILFFLIFTFNLYAEELSIQKGKLEVRSTFSTTYRSKPFSFYLFRNPNNKDDLDIDIAGSVLLLGNYENEAFSNAKDITSILEKSQDWLEKAVENKVNINDRLIGNFPFAILFNSRWTISLLKVSMTINYKDLASSFLEFQARKTKKKSSSRIKSFKIKLNSELYKKLVEVFIKKTYNEKFKTWHESQSKLDKLFN